MIIEVMRPARTRLRSAGRGRTLNRGRIQRVNTTTLACPQCNASFSKRQHNQRFCSQKCKWTWDNQHRTLKPNVFYNCQVCGKAVAKYIDPSSQQNGTHVFKFCSRTCLGASRTDAAKPLKRPHQRINPDAIYHGQGAKHPMWKGGRHINSQGYVLVYAPNHPSASKKGLVREHRLIMEKHLGRYLSRTEVVHHINGDRADNRIENLELFSDNAAHKRHDYLDHARNDKGQFVKGK